MTKYPHCTHNVSGHPRCCFCGYEFPQHPDLVATVSNHGLYHPDSLTHASNVIGSEQECEARKLIQEPHSPSEIAAVGKWE